MEANKMKILAIDDNQDNLIILKALINEAFQYAILSTSLTGEKGLEIAKTGDPDVILLDIVMPGMDGYEVCRKLKADPFLRDIPVVFLTALKGDKESRIRALECGGEAFLAKPIDETELTAQIRAMVKIKQANLEKRNEKERLEALVAERTRQLQQELEERKRAEKALKESEERFQMLFNQAPLGYQSLDFEGCFIEVNQQWLNTLGYTREEVLGKWFGDFLSPEYQDGFRKRFPLFKAQGFIHSEFEMVHKNGQKLFIAFEGKIGYDLEGKFKQTHCILQDITQSKKALDSLKESEERFKHIFEAANVGKSITKITGEINVNQAFCNMLGYTKEELKNKKWIDITPLESIAPVQEILDELLSGKKNEVRLTKQYLHKKGHAIWTDVSVVLLRDAQGKPQYFITTVIDIDEQVKAKEALLESEELNRTLLNGLPESAFLMDLEGNVILANNTVAKRLGKSVDEILGKNIYQTVAPEVADIRRKFALQVIETGKPVEFEDERFGRAIDNRIHPLFDREGKLNRLAIIGIDITDRKIAEFKLKQSYDLLNKLTAMVPGVVYQYRLYPDGRSAFPISSPGMWDIYEVTPEEVREDASLVFTRLHPDDRDFVVDAINDSAQNMSLFHCEYRVILPQQGLRWRLCDAKPERLDDGSTLWYGIITDITERKDSEEKIRESEQQYRTLADSGTALIWRSGTDKLCSYFNQPWLNFTGRTLEQEYGNGWAEGVHPDDFDRCLQTYTWAFDRRQPFEMEYRLRHVSGEYRWIRDLGTANYDSKGEFIGYIGYCFDITERKQIEIELIRAKEKAEVSEKILTVKNAELSEKNTFIQTILDNLPIGVGLNEITSGKVSYLNKKFQEIYGWSFDDLSSVDEFFQKVYPDDKYRKDLVEWVMGDIQSGDPSRMHWENIEATRQDGSKRIINAVNIPLVEQNTMVSTVIDITDLHNIQRDLIEAKEKAEESDRLKSAFLANMSHEIRTPMNSIMGFASLLPDEESRELMNNYANIIVRSSEQLVHIIDDIVLYSRLQTKLLSFNPRPFNVHNLLSDVKDSFNLPDKKKGIDLIIETTSEIPVWISSDYEKLRQIFTNLVSNAFKYTFSGSITLGFCPNENELEFFVRDTGLGIPANEVEKVFERFYRGSNVNKGVIGGTGLGLSIVKELVDLLGGKIWVESEEGKGSTFFFSLPGTRDPGTRDL